MWAVLVVCMFFNTFLGFLLPAIEVLVLILHVLGFVAVLIPLTYLGPHGSAKEIFTTFLNAGGWPTMPLSFFIGLQGSAAAFLGNDGAIHVSLRSCK